MPESWKGRVFVKFGHCLLGDWKLMAFEMNVDRYDCQNSFFTRLTK